MIRPRVYHAVSPARDGESSTPYGEEMRVNDAMYARIFGSWWVCQIVERPVAGFPIIHAPFFKLRKRVDHGPSGGGHQKLCTGHEGFALERARSQPRKTRRRNCRSISSAPSMSAMTPPGG